MRSADGAEPGPGVPGPGGRRGTEHGGAPATGPGPAGAEGPDTGGPGAYGLGAAAGAPGVAEQPGRRVPGSAGPGAGGPPGLSYPERGATRGGPLPAGYRHLRYSARVGHGAAAHRAAGAAVTEWRMHRASGVRLETDARRAEPGVRVRVLLGAGPLRIAAGCEVVWAVYGERETGFAYGTLTGHPERGEESFVTELREDGSVWFTVTAFSRPARRYTRYAGPLVPLFQELYVRILARAVRRFVSAPDTGGDGVVR
jgi:uncharacterized protein (UPF0548 family)